MRDIEASQENQQDFIASVFAQLAGDLRADPTCLHIPSCQPELRWTGPHWHPVPECFVQLNGRTTVTGYGATCILRPGDCLLMEPGMPHSERGDEGRAFLIIKCREGAVHYHVDAFGQRRFRARVEPLRDGQRLLSNWEWICELSARGEADALLASIMASTCDVLSHLCKQSITAEPSSLLERMEHYIRTHAPHEQITVESMAAVFRCSPDHLSRQVKEACGMGASALINEVRLRQVARLLRSTDLSVAYIASQCGYRDPAYMARRFRRRFGRNPSAYRSAESF